MSNVIRYYHDPDTGLPHIYGHGVREIEVEEVLAHPLENRPGANNSRVIIGRTTAGRLLKVIIVEDEDGSGIFVVTAYDVVGKHWPPFAGACESEDDDEEAAEGR
jgi:hypothetical protein